MAHPEVVALRGAGRGRDSGGVDVLVEPPQTALTLRPYPRWRGPNHNRHRNLDPHRPTVGIKRNFGLGHHGGA